MVMGKNLKSGGNDFAKTHPAPQDRVDKIQQKLDIKYSPVRTPEARQSRFMMAVGKI